jgi:hypothetical protein
VGFLGAAILATRLHRRRAAVLPSWFNIAAAALVGVGAPLAGLWLAPAAVRHLGWRQDPALEADADAQDYWHAAVDADWRDYRVQGFTAGDLRRWCWPSAWVVLPLAGWGLWRSFRRGWKNWARKKAPAAWALTLYALLAAAVWALRPAGAGGPALLPLAGLAVLLGVFGVSDVLRGFMERLVLAPPQERDE